ncbi:trk system potassium uptake protein TrkH [Orenia marismortui]|uniref:Trk system potassium uptake protein TrkH n=1 Tax=Orenia marismortui TaxID=46469 RepID=A0A4V3GXT3_9FIRM|nr:trk system potassium uptake protein TrkH [Orenia marismortui]
MYLYPGNIKLCRFIYYLEVNNILSNIKSLTPARFLTIGYLLVISVGTFLLTLPITTVDGRGLNIVDALFTATSATAVTGLIVVDTATYLTTFGQIVVLVLIQIGGFGFMTTSTLFALLLGRKISFRERIIIREELNHFTLSGVIKLARYVIALTLGIEFTGALLLFLKFKNTLPISKAIYFSVFHAISAFCNAGFALFSNSLENFVGNYYVNIIITTLFILGGLGFAVIADLYEKRRFVTLSLNSKLVLLTTIILILIGSSGIFLLESSNQNTFGQLALEDRFISAYFQGVTPRTAGFNTIAIGDLTQGSLFLIIILMFIGASPGSTGGGLKTTTIGVLIVATYSLVIGKDDAELFRRRLSQITVYKALAVTIVSLLVIILATLILTITESFKFIEIFFETVSAYATVGLSTGITGGLSTIGRVLITIIMFTGRVGPLTLAMALGERERSNKVRYPEEKILIG